MQTVRWKPDLGQKSILEYLAQGFRETLKKLSLSEWNQNQKGEQR